MATKPSVATANATLPVPDDDNEHPAAAGASRKPVSPLRSPALSQPAHYLRLSAPLDFFRRLTDPEPESPSAGGGDDPAAAASSPSAADRDEAAVFFDASAALVVLVYDESRIVAIAVETPPPLRHQRNGQKVLDVT
jgi:hypothetical protein